MANDFKRMWTKEELKDTYKLNIEWDATTTYSSYDYTKEELFNISKYNNVLVNGKFLFRKTYSDYDRSKSIAYTLVRNNTMYSLSLNFDEEPYAYSIGIDRDTILFGSHFEELVRATPTDVSIIEDQGKLELMLEHDGNVLAINDTPNQFLQRRLDKPSAEWNSETSESDLHTWLFGQELYVGQIVYFYRYGSMYPCMFTGKSGGGSISILNFKPLSNEIVDGGLVLTFEITNQTENITCNLHYGTTTSVQWSLLDIYVFKLF